MDRRQRRHHRFSRKPQHRPLQRTRASHMLIEAHTINELHHQVRRCAFGDDFDHVNGVLARHPPHRFTLASKPFPQTLICS